MVNSNPIFIIGSPRSGTTLLRLMLTCHKNMCFPPECGFLVWLYPKYGHKDEAFYGGAGGDDFLDDLVMARKFECWGLSRDVLSGFIREKKPRSYAELVQSVYACYAVTNSIEKERWGDKNNFYLEHVDTIYNLFPDACFLHIVRDGRDVACSYKNMSKTTYSSSYAPQLPSDINEIAQKWQADIDVIQSSFKNIEKKQICEIKFEDLVCASEETLKYICAFLKEEYDAEMLSYYKHNTKRELVPSALREWKEKNFRPLIPEECGRFRKELSVEERMLFQEQASSALEMYGYLAS